MLELALYHLSGTPVQKVKNGVKMKFSPKLQVLSLCKIRQNFINVVELAGVEPASAIPTSSVLHAYSVFLLTSMTPTDRLQLLASPIKFNASAPDKASTRVYLRSSHPDPVS